jgi:hypothetical protein
MPTGFMQYGFENNAGDINPLSNNQPPLPTSLRVQFELTVPQTALTVLNGIFPFPLSGVAPGATLVVINNSQPGSLTYPASATPRGLVVTTVSGVGVYAHATTGNGVEGRTSSGAANGVYGVNTSYGPGVYGESRASSAGPGAAIYGRALTPGGYAGYFDGKVFVVGFLWKNGGGFQIDNPRDSANSYLYHSYVESNDMMTVYNGNITTDADGNATVELPGYFEALNRDFRYQLTVIGEFAQAIVAEEVRDNRFGIKTDKPNVRVSWQVTGIRQDAWANANRIEAEVQKPEGERGKYVSPREHGQPETAGIFYIEPLESEEIEVDSGLQQRQQGE